MSTPAIRPEAQQPAQKTVFLPREHGATAMTLTPIVCAAILARGWRWAELAALVAAFAALAVKDPLVVLVRRYLVWKRPHPDTAAAWLWLAIWSALLAGAGLALLLTWPWRATLALGSGVLLFCALAIWVNVKNRQRSTLFQIVSAAALTSSSLATALAAVGSVPGWAWRLWILLALQASVGILVVHTRLDARIALRKPEAADGRFRRASFAGLAALVVCAVAAAALRNFFVGAGLLLAAAYYFFELHAQRNPDALQLPLKKVGQRALLLSSVYAILVCAGLW